MRIKLCFGPGEQGVSHCVMSATSLLAGEEFSDSPECVCPVLADICRTLNDYFVSDEVRSELLGHLPWVLIGTRAESAEGPRRELLLKWAINNEYTPAAGNWLDRATIRQIVNAGLNRYGARYGGLAGPRSLVELIENKLIPIYTTMPLEPGYDERLIYETSESEGKRVRSRAE